MPSDLIPDGSFLINPKTEHFCIHRAAPEIKLREDSLKDSHSFLSHPTSIIIHTICIIFIHHQARGVFPRQKATTSVALLRKTGAREIKMELKVVKRALKSRNLFRFDDWYRLLLQISTRCHESPKFTRRHKRVARD